MSELESSPTYKSNFIRGNIAIKPSSIHRYGVFAMNDIAKKEIIEECPVIVFNREIRKHSQDIADRAFRWDDNQAVILLGYGSMYNHSSDPNATYCLDKKDQTVTFIATKPIPAGSEILVNYGDDWFSSRNNSKASLWREKFRPFKIFLIFGALLILSKIFPQPVNAAFNSVRGHAPTGLERSVSDSGRIIMNPASNISQVRDLDKISGN